MYKIIILWFNVPVHCSSEITIDLQFYKITFINITLTKAHINLRCLKGYIIGNND